MSSAVLCCCLFPCAMYPCAGKMVASPPGQGSVPGGYYWSGGYWGYCPPPSPPTPMLMSPPPPPPGNTQSFIKSPQALSFWTAAATGLAPVLLDATGSYAAPSRRIVSVQHICLRLCHNHSLISIDNQQCGSVVCTCLCTSYIV
jgi:hypothetical protein